MPKCMSMLAAALGIGLIAATAVPASAQSTPSSAQPSWGLECGGQYECVPSVLLTEAEAKRCLGYPHPARTPLERHVDATPAKDSCDTCEGTKR
jgi:hypothetical protein